MFTTLALTGVAAHAAWGPGFGWWFLLIPFFWILFFVLIFGFFGRRFRRQVPPWAGQWQQPAGRSAEATLAQRFANGDIEEVEYRARLEVLRANNPMGPGPS